MNTTFELILSRPVTIRNFLRLFRIKQWLKNSFVFAALFFSGQFFRADKLLLTTLAFIAFCLISSSVYIFNDIVDCEKDKLHPQKKDRPLAAGIIKIHSAAIYGILFLCGSLLLSWSLNLLLFNTLVIYAILNISYSLWLKNIIFIDIFIIAAGFVLRVLAGSVILLIVPSPWLILCTFLLSLFLGLCKRRAEFLALRNDSMQHRKTLDDYNHTTLTDQLIGMTISTTIITYSLYTYYSPVGIKMMGTIPFVIFTIFRYLFLVYKKEEGGDTANTFFNDKILMLSFTSWVGATLWLIYFYKI